MRYREIFFVGASINGTKAPKKASTRFDCETPCSMEQGIFSAEQGTESGNLKWLLAGQKPERRAGITEKILDFIGGRCRFRTSDPRLVRSRECRPPASAADFSELFWSVHTPPASVKSARIHPRGCQTSCQNPPPTQPETFYPTEQYRTRSQKRLRYKTALRIRIDSMIRAGPLRGYLSHMPFLARGPLFRRRHTLRFPPAPGTVRTDERSLADCETTRRCNGNFRL